VGQRGVGGGNGLPVSWRCKDVAGRSATQRVWAGLARLVPPVSLMRVDGDVTASAGEELSGGLQTQVEEAGRVVRPSSPSKLNSKGACGRSEEGSKGIDRHIVHKVMLNRKTTVAQGVGGQPKAVKTKLSGSGRGLLGGGKREMLVNGGLVVIVVALGLMQSMLISLKKGEKVAVKGTGLAYGRDSRQSRN